MNKPFQLPHISNEQHNLDLLKKYLVDDSCTRYEELRHRLIYNFGYDYFRELQNKAFKELFTGDLYPDEDSL